MADNIAYNKEDIISIEGNGEINTNEKSNSSRMKGAAILLLSFLVPALIFAGFWAVKGITWNGELTPLIYDLNSQYVEFFASLRYVIAGESSPFWNWSLCLGGNYVSLFAYYMASPLSFITCFFALDDMANAIYLLTLLKIGLCGLNFSIFLRWGLKKDRAIWGNVLFSSCYALMSYNVIYSMCLMWLDGIILLPLILLGIEKLLEGKRGFLYYIAIFSCFFCNFYISYMVGIFAALYILTRVVIEYRKERTKELFFVLVRFGLTTILALGTSAILLYPALKGYFAGAQNAMVNDKPAVSFQSILSILFKLLPQQYDGVEGDGLPSIYCGTLIVIFAVVFLIQKRRKLEKVAFLILLLIPFLGFGFDPINYAWHGFQITHSYAYRYAFVFSTILLIMAYQAYLNIKWEKSIWKMLFSVCIFYTFIELFLNGSVITDGLHEELQYSVKSSYDLNNYVYGTLLGNISNDDSFYRISGSERLLDYNIPILYNLNGIQSFTSTFNYGVTFMVRHLGGDGSDRTTSGQGLTVLMDSILGIKYRLRAGALPENYEKVNSLTLGNSTISTFENRDVLSLGYGIHKSSNSFEINSNNVFDIQTSFVNQMGVCTDDLFEDVDCIVTEDENGKIHLQFNNNSEKQFYLYFEATAIEEDYNYWSAEPVISVYINGELYSSVQTRYRQRTYDLFGLKTEEPNEIIIEKPNNWNLFDIHIYGMDWNIYHDIIGELATHQWQIDRCDARGVGGYIFLDENETLFTTIPYMKGLQAKVDGKEAEIRGALGCFTTIDVPEGEHYVEVTFVPEGFDVGLGIFGASILLSTLYFALIPLFCSKNMKKTL